MAPKLSPLPIDEVLPEVVLALQKSNRAILCAPPGAGKTTRVPGALLEAGLAENGKIVVLQPRRIAARTTAARIASERQVSLGEEVGFIVRGESKTSKKTRLEVMTEGILLRRLLDDPFLEDVSIVILDEFHERSLASDLLLGMLRQLQASVRPDIRILVMSATLSAELLAKQLAPCPVVQSEGRTFPVKVRYQPPLDRQALAEHAAKVATSLLVETDGNILVFLPGVGEIRRACELVQSLVNDPEIDVCMLYGDLPLAEQQRVLMPGSRRKIILSTNVAETSLTIEGVTGVVDTGQARILRYDPASGLDKLELEPISQASSQQRAGRAGRTAPGICVRLWPEGSQRHRPEFDTPEIQRVDLAGGLLQLFGWIEPDVSTFPWLEPPEPARVTKSLELLELLDAVRDSAITPIGKELARLPVHPRLGRMLLEGAIQGCVPEAALAAALLSERDPFGGRRSNYRGTSSTVRSHASESDVLDRVQAVQAWRDRSQDSPLLDQVNTGAMRAVIDASQQLSQLAKQFSKSVLHKPAAKNMLSAKSNLTEEEAPILHAIYAGFPDRVTKRREPRGRRGVLVGGKGIRLADEVAVDQAELFVAVVLDGSQGEALVRQASAIDGSWLNPAFLKQEIAVQFDESTERVTARKRTSWKDLVLEEVTTSANDPQLVEQALLEVAQKDLTKVFPHDNEDVAGFLARCRFLAAKMPERGLPDLNDAQLIELLPQVVSGCRSLADVRKGPWLMAMKGLFEYAQLQLIDKEAPERIAVPSGSHIRIEYRGADEPPILAVRIQELFGMMQTPRLAGGRAPLVVHLLAPNMRVAQVTSDLKSFWENSYQLVRKDLRARYPKHAWPEDPTTAIAQKRPTKKPSA